MPCLLETNWVLYGFKDGLLLNVKKTLKKTSDNVPLEETPSQAFPFEKSSCSLLQLGIAIRVSGCEGFHRFIRGICAALPWLLKLVGELDVAELLSLLNPLAGAMLSLPLPVLSKLPKKNSSLVRT